MTSKVNFDTRPILQLFVIALCAVSQPFNRTITKMILHVSLQISCPLIKGCRMGHSDKVSLWYVSLLINTIDFAFFVLE